MQIKQRQLVEWSNVCFMPLSTIFIYISWRQCLVAEYHQTFDQLSHLSYKGEHTFQ